MLVWLFCLLLDGSVRRVVFCSLFPTHGVRVAKASQVPTGNTTVVTTIRSAVTLATLVTLTTSLGMVYVTSLLMLWIGSKGLTFWLPLSLTRGLPVGVGWDAGSTIRTTSLGMIHVTSLLMLWMGLKGLTFWLPLSRTHGLPVGVGWDEGFTRRSCVTASVLFQCLCRFSECCVLTALMQHYECIY